MRPTLIAILAVLAGTLCAQSYIGSSSNQAYSNTALSSPTLMNMGHDTISAEQAPAGFSFDFFGVSCDRYRIGSNGYITLGNAANAPSSVANITPDVSSGMVIAALWLDLDVVDVVSKYVPAAGGGPGMLVVRWGPVWTRTLPPPVGPLQSAPGAVLFEMKLDTATGTIQFRYGYPSWHGAETTGEIHSECIAGPAGSGQEIICQPVASSFTADGEMLKYNYNFEITFTPAVPNLIVSDGAPVTYGLPAAGTQRDFGGQDINAGPTSPRVITLSNWGTGGLGITGVSITGADSGSFSLDTSMTTASVAPNGSTTFEVSFDPATVGAKTAQLEVSHDDASQQNPFVFEVAGTGMPTSIFPVITVRETDAAGTWIGNGAAASGNRQFPSYTIGTTAPAAALIYIENAGTVALTLGAISCNSPHFTFDTAGVPASLAPGASATFTIRFDAQAAGIHAGAITFAHNDITTTNPFTINVAGTAVGNGTTGGNGGGGGGGCTAATGGSLLPLLGLLVLYRRRRK